MEILSLTTSLTYQSTTKTITPISSWVTGNGKWKDTIRKVMRAIITLNMKWGYYQSHPNS